VKVRVVVGSVEVRLDGLALTIRQVRTLLRDAASIAVALDEAAPNYIDPDRSGFGFTLSADTQLADFIDPNSDEYYEDEDKPQR